MNHTYDTKQLKDAVRESRSIRQTLQRLNLKPYGANYKTLHASIAKHNIDISHFTGQAWAQNKKWNPKRPLVEYLCNEVSIGSNRLRTRLLREGVFEPKCQSCENTHWLGKPITLELDHIDGNSSNNSLFNLRILCPNCHSQTDTWRRRK